MIWRIAGSVLAVLVLAEYRFFSKTQAQSTEITDETWSLPALFLASALTLFAELALIRWVATEIRVFAYVKNLALLLCFLGFGLGCALARETPRWKTAVKALLGLILIVRFPVYGARVMEDLSQLLGAARDVQIWRASAEREWGLFLLASVITVVLLLLITYIFVPLGQKVSRQIELAPRPLTGYSWNLAGSLAGILIFFAVSWMALPPSLWFTMVLAGMLVLQPLAGQRILLGVAAVAAVLLLVDPATAHHFNLWTPYQQIEFQDYLFPSGEVRLSEIRVNHTGYQMMVNLSQDFLARHPNLLKGPQQDNPYNFPFRFTAKYPRVLIVGSGTGNDVAAALRNQSSSVDAVEIDPAILKLGRRHPERPYEDPRVHAHLTDARAFMKRAPGGYDLILFGLLDSHTQLSDYSNMRIDNFVYTEESFREARALLGPRGVLFVKFQVDRPWLGHRLEEMLAAVFGKEPSVFLAPSTYGAGATCFVTSSSDQVDDKLASDSQLWQFVDANRPAFTHEPVPVTSDDWPYLYQKDHAIPGVFFLVSVLVILLVLAFYLQIPEARKRAPSLFFFAMGAGFLLLETQIVSRLALYFGTTWQVNGIVIAAILAALLFANYVTEKLGDRLPRWWTLALLLAGIAFAYIFPFQRIPAAAAMVGMLAALVFAVPVFFAGLLFAAEFRLTESPAAALGANMLGAVVGGLLENTSLVFGMKALLVIAAILYAVAGVGLRSAGRRGSAAKV